MRRNLHEKIDQVSLLAYIKELFVRQAFEKAIVIKVFYHHLESKHGEEVGAIDLPAVLDWLTTHKDIKIIHLKRRDYLKTIYSIKAAKITKNYMETTMNKPTLDAEFALGADECETHFRQIRQWEKTYDEHFRSRTVLEIHYEDLVQHPQSEHARLLEFVGVQQRRLKTETKKQRKKPLSELISNYEELRRHFAGTEWSCYFR